MVEVKKSEIPQKNRIITILGPTASGKTSRAVDLANYLEGEIISADSRQVYRDMNLGTGKDLDEYGNVPYHLIDICEAGDKYNLHRFITDFHIALNNINSRGKQPIVCGGTGMYLENALSGIRLPEVPPNLPLRSRLEKFTLNDLTLILKKYKILHNTTDIDTVKRAVRAIEIEEYYLNNPDEAKESNRKSCKALDSVIIGINVPREVRRQRISNRLKLRLEQGMVDEIKSLLDKGISQEDLIYYGLEYKYLTLYVTGQISYSQMEHDLEIAIHQFAKRQMTWFRGMERRGFKINWINYDMTKPEFLETVKALLQ